jgi:hypothetical protein
MLCQRADYLRAVLSANDYRPYATRTSATISITSGTLCERMYKLCLTTDYRPYAIARANALLPRTSVTIVLDV